MTGAVAASPSPRRQPAVPTAVFAMALFLFTEVMFFCGLISSFIVLRAQAGPWPPPGQPRLPVGATAFNTALLLASGVTVWLGVRALARDDRRRFLRLLAATLALGASFLLLQGNEWVSLVRFGLTTSSSLYGSLFYTLVGAHAVHVLAAVMALGYVLHKAKGDAWGAAETERVAAMQMYWLFVVAVWPPLYGLVYLW